MSDSLACSGCCHTVPGTAIKVCIPKSQCRQVEVDDDIRAFVRLATLGTYDPFDSMTLR